MSREFEQRAIIAALERRTENAEKAATLAAIDKQSVWFASCPYCGTKLHGTVAELKAHSCGK